MRAYAWSSLASSPGLQLCGGKAWYLLHAHARAFCNFYRIRIRTDIVGLYVYGQFYGKVYGNIAHAHAVDTKPSFRIFEGLGTRLGLASSPGCPMYTKTEQELGNEARHGRGRQIHLFAINYSPIIWIIKKSRSVAQHAINTIF